MMRIIKQSREEMLAMYMKCTKKELAEMLANRDSYLDEASGKETTK